MRNLRDGDVIDIGSIGSSISGSSSSSSSSGSSECCVCRREREACGASSVFLVQIEAFVVDAAVVADNLSSVHDDCVCAL